MGVSCIFVSTRMTHLSAGCTAVLHECVDWHQLISTHQNSWHASALQYAQVPLYSAKNFVTYPLVSLQTWTAERTSPSGVTLFAHAGSSCTSTRCALTWERFRIFCEPLQLRSSYRKCHRRYEWVISYLKVLLHVTRFISALRIILT